MGSKQIFCDLPGAPAVPYQGQGGTYEVEWKDGTEDRKEPGRLTVDLVDGGVAIYGGRVNLVVRRCTLGKGSGLAIRHATGSGLDVVELGASSEEDPGHIELFGSAVRHLTVTAKPGEVGFINLIVTGAVLAQAYIGTGLGGHVKADNSALLQVWNASPHSDASTGVEFSATDCSVHGALDITVEDSSSMIPPGAEVEKAAFLSILGPSEERLERLERMDYRRNPAQLRSETQRNQAIPLS